MVLADARASVKRELDIDQADVNFDDIIDDFIGRAVKRLFPFQFEKQPFVVSISPSNGRATINISEHNLSGVRYIEVASYDYFETHSDYSQHGDLLIIDGLSDSHKSVQLYGLEPFTLDNVFPYLEESIVYFSVASFYRFLLGNKRKYNVYMQNGRSAVDNMQDVADYYDQQANQIVIDRATLYGLS